MSYQVLARKWRPKKFQDVIGQSHVTRSLQNAIAKNKITAYNRDEVVIATEVLPIGKTYRQEARMALDN